MTKDRVALGEFLRLRREQLHPRDVGLVEGGRRRTPGLRRDEVSLLANMSTNYYERLEQGRGPQPSPSMLGAIARALRLTLDERDHLYVLGGHQPPAAHVAQGYADPGLMTILDALAPQVPALVSDDLSVVVAQNPLNVALLGQLAGQPGHGANFTWRWFTDPAYRILYAQNDRDLLSRGYVADLRVSVTRRGPDPVASRLVHDLCAASAEFAEVWARHEVATKLTTRKVLTHPTVGRLDCECDVVVSPPSGQRLVLFRGAPGTDTAERLDLLRVLGSQNLSVETDAAEQVPDESVGQVGRERQAR